MALFRRAFAATRKQRLLVVAARLRLFQKRFIADALSAGNLLCGVGSIVCALA